MIRLYYRCTDMFTCRPIYEPWMASSVKLICLTMGTCVIARGGMCLRIVWTALICWKFVCNMNAHEAHGNKQHTFGLICSSNMYWKKQKSTCTSQTLNIKGHSSPLFSAHVYCGQGRPSQPLLSSCLCFTLQLQKWLKLHVHVVPCAVHACNVHYTNA